MFLKTLFSAAFLAFSVNAAAVPAAGKSFKFMVEDPAKGNFYLADATGLGTQDASKALACELSDSVLKCGGKGFPNFSGDMTKLATTGSSSGWSIDSNDNINWSAKPNMKFTVGMGTANELWAEVCPHHFTVHGTAKAVYDQVETE